MPLGGKYEDFPDLCIKDLTNYLSVRGLDTSAGISELLYQRRASRAFPAFELKMNIITSSESGAPVTSDKWSNNL